MATFRFYVDGENKPHHIPETPSQKRREILENLSRFKIFLPGKKGDQSRVSEVVERIKKYITTEGISLREVPVDENLEGLESELLALRKGILIFSRNSAAIIPFLQDLSQNQDAESQLVVLVPC